MTRALRGDQGLATLETTFAITMPELRAFLAEQLRVAGIDSDRVSVEVAPSRVGWREPVRVSLSSAFPVSIPFLFSTSVPLRSSAISRGEVNR
ncbi:MAG: hypothetical protein E6I54_04390 [Chloroflexi bacterium]|nr:MAG: hypothetical protein E6I54_04390 [Chloroflexota bacterium]